MLDDDNSYHNNDEKEKQGVLQIGDVLLSINGTTDYNLLIHVLF